MSSRIPQRKVYQNVGGIDIVYHLDDFGYQLHREDGPAFIREYDDGSRMEVWYYEGKVHRYDGPARTNMDGTYSYFIHGRDVDILVEEWLSERDCDWDTMTDIEKWELELFMRSLG